MAEKEVRLRITTDSAGAIRGIEQVTGGLKNMEANSGSIISKIKGHWLGLSAAVYGAYRSLQGAWNLIEMAAKYEEQRTLLNRWAGAYGTTADQIIADIQRMTDGMVSRVDIAQTALSGLAKQLTPDQLSNLARASYTLAKQSTESTAEVFNSLVEAIASGRERSIKMLAGIVDLETRYTDKQISNMSAAQRAHALYEMVVERARKTQALYGDEADSTADKMERLQARIKDLRLEVGQLAIRGLAVATAGFYGLAAGIIAVEKSFYDFMDMMNRFLGWMADKFGNNDIIQSIAPGMADLLKEFADTRKDSAENWKLMSDAADRNMREYVDKAKENWDAAWASNDLMQSALSPEAPGGKKLVDNFARLIEKLKFDASKLGMNDYEAKLADIDQQFKELARDWGNLKVFEELKKKFKDYAELTNTVNENVKNMNLAAQIAERSAKNRLDFEKELLTERAKYGQYSPAEQVNLELDQQRKLLEVEKARLAVSLQAAIEKKKLYNTMNPDVEREITDLKAQQLDLTTKIANIEEIRTVRLKEFLGSFSEGLDVGARKYYNELEGSFRRGEDLSKRTAQSMEQSFSDGFFNVLTGQIDSFSDVWKTFCNSIARAWSDTMAKMVMESLKGSSTGGLGSILETITGIFGAGGGGSDYGWGGYSAGDASFGLGTPYAKGGVFDSGRVTAFASGGIFDRPTVFRMAKGMGLMGEDGPEAVMPLGRTASGELGVKGSGGGGTIIINNIRAIDTQSFGDACRRNSVSITSTVTSAMKDGKLKHWKQFMGN